LGQTELKGARKKTSNKWYETQDSISYWDDFSKQKIVWARLMRISKNTPEEFPRFSFVKDEAYPVDSLCFFTGEKLSYLQAVLNSEFAKYWFFNNIAILDNGGMQMRQQYVELFPIPVVENDKMSEVEKLSKTDTTGSDVVIYAMYSFTPKEIEYMQQFIRDRISEIQGN
jgi:hypothetical protein